MPGSVVIRGARQHNLKNLDLEIPHHKLTVITGVSGSGKSSLAFDTLYAEGQRRYIESLSTYAKQFLERISRPDVDEISGICPSIAIQRKNTVQSSRSTVGTATEIHDYLRLLFARIGRTHCPDCGLPVVKHAPDEVIDELLSKYEGKVFLVCANMELQRNSLDDLLARFVAEGYTRIVAGGRLARIDSETSAEFAGENRIRLVLDRLEITRSARARLLEAIEAAYRFTGGTVELLDENLSRTATFTSRLACTKCKRSFTEPRPILFSFNNPYGACPYCRGFGNRMEFDESLIVPDPERSLRDRAIEPWASPKMEYFHEKLMSYCRRRKIPVNKPFGELEPEARRLILEGDEGFKGVIPFLEEMKEKSYKRYARFFTRRFLSFRECRHCRGGRLREEAYYVLIQGKDIRDVSRMTPAEALAFVESIELGGREAVIAEDILHELTSRLRFLLDVGLYYITLDRLTRTLSGGEAQRINLANSLGANLVDILYVLDEPSIGLHPRDTAKLMKVLRTLRDRGNTVVVVEHDLDIIRSADYMIDLGPGAGEKGGEILYRGPVRKSRPGRSKTLKVLQNGLPVGRRRRKSAFEQGWIKLSGVTEHNLKNIEVAFPLGALTVVTGVSGSGKSTLVCDVLYPALKTGGRGGAGAYTGIEGADRIDRVMMVDQSPIGKTARSNPITYVKAFSFIRDIFASRRESVKRGYGSGRFSFNVPGGRCSRCDGLGYEKVEMHFMADMMVPCSDCGGKRFNPETLEITFKGKNLAEVLELTVEEARDLFGEFRPLAARLSVLERVGLGYLRLGQPSTTLSGGESQRLKIARELAESAGGGSLYILDEPTSGLHVLDVEVLIDVLFELVGRGNTVIVIEHNPQVILRADYVIDLGPGGGEEGGRVVASGSPEEVARTRGSHTGVFLKRILREKRRVKS